MKVCPGSDTLLGIDVSHYQGTIDWAAVKASGRVFAVASVGDGTFKDPKFGENWPAMKAAGVVRGAYQFWRPGTDPIVQADILLDMMGPLEPGDLPPTVDVEADDGQPPGVIVANLHAWIDHVKAATGLDPIVYTGRWFWDPKVASGEFGGNPLWIASYGVTCPDVPPPWSTFVLHQYSSTGSVGGIAGAVDEDLFNGSMADLAALGKPAAPPPDAAPPSDAAGPPADAAEPDGMPPGKPEPGSGADAAADGPAASDGATDQKGALDGAGSDQAAGDHGPSASGSGCSIAAGRSDDGALALDLRALGPLAFALALRRRRRGRSLA